jgi:hypothetical protein
VSTDIGFRISSWKTPLYVNPPRRPGRFHVAGSPPTQYICLHPLGPWAEYLRNSDLRRPEDIADLRLNVWALKLDLGDVLWLDFEAAERRTEEPGIRPEDLVGDDHMACRQFADRLRSDSATPKALVVPSAALPGTRNLVIFGPRVQIPYLWEPVDYGDIPACAVTKASQPPEGLLERVRFRRQSHAELDAWREGQRFDFPDLHEEPVSVSRSAPARIG